MRGLVVIALALVACRPVGPDYPGAPDLAGGERFSGSAGRVGPLDRWWRPLGDGQLNGLVDEALRGNRDLAVARERLREARALRRQAAAAFLPQAAADLSFTHLDFGEGDGGLTGQITATGLIPDPLDYWTAGMDVSWEIDVFGGRRREAAAAEARAQAAEEQLHGVRLAVAAEMVESYFTLAGLNEQRAELERQVGLQEDELAKTRQREAAGAASKLEVDRLRARLEQTRTELPPLQSGIASQRNRIALLLGVAPSAMEKRQSVGRSLPRKLPMVGVGLPAELVMRRPDLRQAERELAAATEDIGVATANFYPRFSLLGSPSASTSRFSDLFTLSNFDLQVGPAISWSVFSGGANRALLEAADARQKQALHRYEKAVLGALGEVESELADLRAERQRLVRVMRAREATATAVERVRQARDAGAVATIDVLVEEQRLREVEIAEIRVKSQLALVWVRLHKALGGGWR